MKKEELKTLIEDAIQEASKLGNQAYDKVDGRGLMEMRLRIIEALDLIYGIYVDKDQRIIDNQLRRSLGLKIQ